MTRVGWGGVGWGGVGWGGEGGHWHIASDMDVRHFRVPFWTLESAKGVFLTSKICRGCHFQAIQGHNFRKNITFFI